VRTETLPAPHSRPLLPPGQSVVYVFAISEAHGRSAPCGPGTVLKVGRVGPGNRRFTHSHYNPVAPTISTLAQSLAAHPILWPWLGIEHLDTAQIPGWMLASLNRFHFFLPGDRPQVCAALEIYVRARVGSVFEGVGHGWSREGCRRWAGLVGARPAAAEQPLPAEGRKRGSACCAAAASGSSRQQANSSGTSPCTPRPRANTGHTAPLPLRCPDQRDRPAQRCPWASPTAARP
jgi:hypothetical protein